MAAEVGQLEFKWTKEGQKGFSVIASSASANASQWASRLRPLARPPEIQQSATVVYKVFDDEAALMFRFLRTPADLAGEQPHASDTGQIVLVTRALVGPVEVLTPQMAIVLAGGIVHRTAFLQPSPGRVAVGAVLPVLSARDLNAEADAAVWQLDKLARDTLPLEPVIAVALSDPRLPLILQVPEDKIGEESTAGLLWGLWRTTGPFLDRVPGWQWSFSTGEPPPGDIGQADLPHLVIRGLPTPGDPRPSVARPENVVQPWQVDTVGADAVASAAAYALVTAYRRSTPEVFSGQLEKICDSGDTFADQIAAIAAELGTSQGTAIAAEQGPVQGSGQGTAVRAKSGTLQGAGPGGSAVVMTSEYRQPVLPRHAAQQGQQAARRGVPSVGAGFGQLRPHRGPKSFSQLFQQLAGIGADFDAALHELEERRNRGELPDTQERAALRTMMEQHSWFVPQFRYQRPRKVPDCVVLLVDLAVMPDLADPADREGTVQQLQRWVTDERTPGAVVLALDDFIWAHQDRDLQNKLFPQLGLRWLAEHGRYGMLRPPVQDAPGCGTDRSISRWWLLFRGATAPARWANIFAWLCLVEVIIIVILLVAP